MKIQLTLECTHDKFTQCLATAWEKAYDEPLPALQIVPFTVGAVVAPSDVKNMTAGSCLAELIDDNTIMEVVRLNVLQWSGGRLCGVLDGKKVSFSIDEAYALIPEDDRVAEACEDVLEPYDKYHSRKENFLINQERQGKNEYQIKQSGNRELQGN